mgnify:CR=1 FL=1
MMKIVMIGGGAAGLAAAVMLARAGREVTVLERGERVGRKLSATGNGQGNVTNVNMGAEHYFSDDAQKVARVLSRCSAQDAVAFLESMGGVFLPDARGRVYPAGRQASAVTDLFRRELSRLGVRVVTGARVEKLTFAGQFTAAFAGGSVRADAAVLAAGGRAAKQFGTDGTAYALAQAFGHTVTPTSPVLVQLRCDPASVRGLKGIRVDAGLNVLRAGKEVYRCRGDVLFTESGISGDAVFRASSYARPSDMVCLDLVPDADMARLQAAAGEGESALLCIVCNGLARHILRLSGGDVPRALALVKRFPLTVTGTLGFDYAQATRGGIPLAETDGSLMSRLQNNLFFAGEMLNVDGECGGYNLHWAFASARTVAEALS